MNISRRHFVGGVTGCAATLWSFQPFGLNTLCSQSEREIDCVLLDLNSRCVLRESLHGYQVALAGEHNLVQDIGLNSRHHYRIAIVPGLGAMDPAIASTLSNLLEAGTHVLLESGAGFLSPAEFAAHQRMLHRHFDIAVGSPIDLWAAKPAGDDLLRDGHARHPGKKLNSYKSIPYVNYLWPSDTKLRDFSRVIPVSASVGDVIGKVGALPVALKRRMAKGTLIFLGSPVGPALHVGDSEALSWLRLVTALSRDTLSVSPIT
jgi:hypothetical protein